MASKNDVIGDLTRKKLIKLIEERAEDVCGGMLYDVEVRIDDLEEDNKKSIKTLKADLKKTTSEFEASVKEMKNCNSNLRDEIKEELKKELVEELIRELKNELRKELKDELSRELREELKKNLWEELNEECNQLQNQVESVKEEIDQMSPAIKVNQSNIHREMLRLKETKIKLDCVEQKFYEKEVQLVGLPESESEREDEKKIIQLAEEKMSLNIQGEIQGVHRLGRKFNKKPRDIIVKFKNKEAREAFYERRKRTAQSKYPDENIYINDHITEYRKKLFYEARKLYKAKLVCAAWTQHGNVLIRKNTDESPVQIFSHSDLEEYRTRSSSDIDQKLSTVPSSSSSIKTHISDYEYWPADFDDL